MTWSVNDFVPWLDVSLPSKQPKGQGSSTTARGYLWLPITSTQCQPHATELGVVSLGKQPTKEIRRDVPVGATMYLRRVNGER